MYWCLMIHTNCLERRREREKLRERREREREEGKGKTKQIPICTPLGISLTGSISGGRSIEFCKNGSCKKCGK